MADTQFFPMMPESSWWAIRQQFKKTIPSAVSVSYLKSLLGLTSDQSARNIVSPLKQMKLIDDEGKPLPRANDWRNDEKYAQICKDILSEVYPSELLDLFPDDDTDIANVKSWFMDVRAIGASAAGKNAATFVLLKNGKIRDANTNSPTKNGTKKATASRPKEVKDVEIIEKKPKGSQMPIDVAKENNKLVPTVHIDLQIHISPDASLEQIDNIFASMAKHLYGKG